MQQILFFLASLPVRLPFTSGLILIYLLLNTFCWLGFVNLGKGPGADAALLPFLLGLVIGKLFLLIGIPVFLIELGLQLSKGKPFVQKPGSLSYTFWLIFLLGLFPFISMYGFIILTITGASASLDKAGKQLAEIPYAFAGPQEKLRHDLSMSRINNVRKYLAAGADINTIDARGTTVLSLAINKHDYDLATELINQGADIHITDRDEHNALYAVLQREHDRSQSNPEKAKLALLLLNKGAVVTDTPDRDLLQGAIETGSKELVEKLLQKGFNLDTSQRRIHTYLAYACDSSPLSDAARIGNREMVELLLKKGSDINGPNSKRTCSPLLEAIEAKQLETAVLLIDQGADVNTKDSDGNTALMKAIRARLGSQFFLRLIRKGANINAVGSHGTTALSEAADTGNLDDVRMFLQAGVKVPANSEAGQRALWMAILGNNADIVKLFLKQGNDPNSPTPRRDSLLSEAVERDNAEIVKLLLDSGAIANNLIDNGNPALFIATSKGNKEIIKLLIERGADVNETHWGRSALTETILRGKESLEIAEMLLKAGADPNIKGGGDRTALDFALEQERSGTAQGAAIVSLLRQYGARTSSKQKR